MGSDGSALSAVAEHYLKLALEDYDTGLFEAALQGCDRTLHYAPSLSDAHNLRGVVLEELGRSEEAVDAYGTALDLDPGFHEAWHNLRELAVEWGERLSEDGPALGDGIAQYPDDRIFRHDPDTDVAKLHLAQAYKAYAGGQYDAALRGCLLTLALEPCLADAHNVRGLVLEELDRPGAAAEAYRQAFDLNPNFTEARDNWRELEDELAEKRGPVAVATFLDPLEAHIARGRLEWAGISSYLANEGIVNLNYFWSYGFHGVKLQVTKENAGDALEVLLREPGADEYELGEKDGQPQCMQCWSYDTRYETYNLRLAYLASILLLIAGGLLVLLLPAFLLLIPKRAWTCQSCGHTWKVAQQPPAPDQNDEVR